MIVDVAKVAAREPRPPSKNNTAAASATSLATADGTIFWESAPGPMRDELLGAHCVLWLASGEVVARIPVPGSAPGRYALFSIFGPTREDVEILAAARICQIVPLGAARQPLADFLARAAAPRRRLRQQAISLGASLALLAAFIPFELAIDRSLEPTRFRNVLVREAVAPEIEHMRTRAVLERNFRGRLTAPFGFA